MMLAKRGDRVDVSSAKEIHVKICSSGLRIVFVQHKISSLRSKHSTIVASFDKSGFFSFQD